MSEIVIRFGTGGTERNVINAINKVKAATTGLTSAETENSKGKSNNSKATNSLVNHNRLLNNSLATMRSNLLLVNFALSLGVRQLLKFGEAAAKVDNMERAFNSLSGGAENAEVAIDKLRAATNNTMSDFDLYQQANNAMILGVTKNSDEMAELFDMAQRLGRALGVDTRRSVESLITGIGRQSRLMLDNIGIIVKSEQAYKKYAKELGKTADELTKTEKQQAFMNAVLEAGNTALANLPPEVLSAQDAYNQLGASYDNLKVSIGSVLNVALVPLMTAMSDFINSLDKETIETFIKVVVSLAAAFAILKLRGIAVSLWLKVFPILVAAGSGSLTVFAGAINKALGPMGWLVSIVGTAVYALLELTGILDSTEEESEELNTGLSTLTETIEDIDTKKATQQLDELFKKLSEGNNILRLTMTTMADDKILGDITQVFNDYIAGFADINEKRLADGFADTKEMNTALRFLRKTVHKELIGILGVTEEFYIKFFGGHMYDEGGVPQDHFITSNAILDATYRGLIKTNEEFMAVMEQMVQTGSKLNMEIIKEIVNSVRLTKKKESLKEALEAVDGVCEGLTDELAEQAKLEEKLISLGKRTIEGEMMHLQSLILEAEALKLTTEWTRLKELGLQKLIDKYVELEEQVFGNDDAEEKTHKKSLFRNKSQKDSVLKLFDSMSSVAEQHKQGQKVAARISQLSAIINTYEGVTEALSTKDYIGAAAILAQGLAAVAQIENSMSQMGGSGSAVGKFEHGGYVGGRPHSQGGTIIEAERGEFVMNKNAVESIGLEALNMMNEGGGGAVNVTVTGNVMTQEFVEGELAESIKEAVRRGSDFGIS